MQEYFRSKDGSIVSSHTHFAKHNKTRGSSERKGTSRCRLLVAAPEALFDEEVGQNSALPADTYAHASCCFFVSHSPLSGRVFKRRNHRFQFFSHILLTVMESSHVRLRLDEKNDSMGCLFRLRALWWCRDKNRPAEIDRHTHTPCPIAHWCRKWPRWLLAGGTPWLSPNQYLQLPQSPPLFCLQAAPCLRQRFRSGPGTGRRRKSVASTGRFVQSYLQVASEARVNPAGATARCDWWIVRNCRATFARAGFKTCFYFCLLQNHRCQRFSPRKP